MPDVDCDQQGIKLGCRRIESEMRGHILKRRVAMKVYINGVLRIQIRVIRLHTHVINLTSTRMHHSLQGGRIPSIPVPRCTSQNVSPVFSSLSIQPVDLSWPSYDLLHLTHLFCRIPVVGPQTYGRKKYS